MEQKKSSKKLSYAVIGLAVALVAVVGGLIGVYAATQQTVGSSFDVQYNVTGEIAGSVSAKYNITKDVDMGTAEFDVTDSTVRGELKADETIGLDATNKQVVFTYTFTNVGETTYVATVTDTTDFANVTIEWSKTSVEVAPATDADSDGLISESEAAAAAVEVTCTVTIKDTNKSAHYTSSSAEGSAVVTWALVKKA
ncbi:MAG: hypothetical protein E7379_02955 [Clostridiales bacterium]|nr:hypothetical protein [Clostridiales bacterium]